MLVSSLAAIKLYEHHDAKRLSLGDKLRVYKSKVHGDVFLLVAGANLHFLKSICHLNIVLVSALVLAVTSKSFPYGWLLVNLLRGNSKSK